MNPKPANFFQGKAVLVKVYEEKPRKNYNVLPSKGPRDQHHHVHHHHHHHHHHVCVHNGNKQEKTAQKDCRGDAADVAGQGHNRRACLLLHLQSLRAGSAQPATTSFFQPKQPSPPNNTRQPTKNIVPNQGKPKRLGIPTPGNWKLVLSNFCRFCKCVQVVKSTKQKKHNTGSASISIQAAMKSMKVQKKKGKGLFSKLVPQTN